MALRVKTYVDRSPISGWGLFAMERIPAGSVVWEFDESVDRIQETEVEHFSWRTEDGYVVPGDAAKYINHSSDPNTGTTPGISETVALRDIEVGEEITESYEYDLDYSLYSGSLR